MEPNQMGAAGQPMPNQPLPNQPMPEPVAPVPPVPEQSAPMSDQAAPAMSMEEQMTAAMVETMPDQPTMSTAPALEPQKKSNKAIILGMIFFAIVAIGGIGFGVWMMLDKDNLASKYEEQISSLKKTNSQLMEQLADQDAITSDEALDLLKDGVTTKNLSYNILNANIYAVYNGEEDKTAYWVKYTASTTDAPETIVQYNTIFTLNEDEETWTFEIPGFTASDENFATLTANYTVIE